MSSEHDLNDDLRPEYDFSNPMRVGERGKYAERYHAGPVSLPTESSDDELDNVEPPFHLTPDMIAELDESIAQLDRGEGIPADEVLAELRENTARRQRRDHA